MIHEKQPTCYVIAGPNGAGKTTFALNYLPEIASCRIFVNADLIAQGISPLDSVSAQFEAGRLFLQEIHKNIAKGVDFSFETTLAGRSYVNLLKILRNENWQIVLFFLWIPNADFSRDRVRQRVQEGGHDIPDETIYRRYPRIMHNLIHIYTPLCDIIWWYDNSNMKPVLVYEQDGPKIEILNKEIYENVLRCTDGYQ